MLDTSQGTQYQMSITFSCDTGYSLVGSPTRTCQADGSWSGESPFCEGWCAAIHLLFSAGFIHVEKQIAVKDIINFNTLYI